MGYEVLFIQGGVMVMDDAAKKRSSFNDELLKEEVGRLRAHNDKLVEELISKVEESERELAELKAVLQQRMSLYRAKLPAGDS